MQQSVTVDAQLLWGSRYGCNNGRYGCTTVMSYIEINKALSQWLLTFNLCVSVTWPLICAFHIPCTHTPEIVNMHRGVCDNEKKNELYLIQTVVINVKFPACDMTYRSLAPTIMFNVALQLILIVGKFSLCKIELSVLAAYSQLNQSVDTPSNA